MRGLSLRLAFSGDWVPAGQVELGATILRLGEDGRLHEETVTSVDVIGYEGPVYNIEVTPFHNYIASGVLVHNKSPAPDVGPQYPDTGTTAMDAGNLDSGSED